MWGRFGAVITGSVRIRPDLAAFRTEPAIVECGGEHDECGGGGELGRGARRIGGRTAVDTPLPEGNAAAFAGYTASHLDQEARA